MVFAAKWEKRTIESGVRNRTPHLDQILARPLPIHTPLLQCAKPHGCLQAILFAGPRW